MMTAHQIFETPGGGRERVREGGWMKEDVRERHSIHTLHGSIKFYGIIGS
jgi:hypothetical protein